MNQIGAEVPDPYQLMFIDESAKNDRIYARRYGWSRVGTRCVQRACFVRGKRYSILPVLTLDGIIAYDIIEGSVTSERFVRFLREFVVSSSFIMCFSGSPGSHASQSFPSVIHILVLEVFWSWTTAIFITQRRFGSWLRRKLVCLLRTDYSTTTNTLSVCKLIFLPPYSPDYNPIEQAFSSVKAWIRRHTMERGLLGIVKALQTVTPKKAAGWFRASGYM
jgi:transposase